MSGSSRFESWLHAFSFRAGPSQCIDAAAVGVSVPLNSNEVAISGIVIGYPLLYSTRKTTASK